MLDSFDAFAIQDGDNNSAATTAKRLFDEVDFSGRTPTERDTQTRTDNFVVKYENLPESLQKQVDQVGSIQLPTGDRYWHMMPPASYKPIANLVTADMLHVSCSKSVHQGMVDIGLGNQFRLSFDEGRVHISQKGSTEGWMALKPGETTTLSMPVNLMPGLSTYADVKISLGADGKLTMDTGKEVITADKDGFKSITKKEPAQDFDFRDANGKAMIEKYHKSAEEMLEPKPVSEKTKDALKQKFDKVIDEMLARENMMHVINEGTIKAIHQLKKLHNAFIDGDLSGMQRIIDKMSPWFLARVAGPTLSENLKGVEITSNVDQVSGSVADIAFNLPDIGRLYFRTDGKYWHSGDRVEDNKVLQYMISSVAAHSATQRRATHK